MNELSQDKQVRVIQLFDLGYSLRAVARLAGCNRMTASRYRNLFVPHALCPCGRDAKHKGWCKWRFSHSPARQEYMQSIGHLRNKIEPISPTLFFPYIIIPKCENCGESRATGSRYCSTCYWEKAGLSTNPYYAVSLDAARGENLSSSLHELLASSLPSPDEILMRKEEAELERPYRDFWRRDAQPSDERRQELRESLLGFRLAEKRA